MLSLTLTGINGKTFKSLLFELLPRLNQQHTARASEENWWQQREIKVWFKMNYARGNRSAPNFTCSPRYWYLSTRQQRQIPAAAHTAQIKTLSRALHRRHIAFAKYHFVRIGVQSKAAAASAIDLLSGKEKNFESIYRGRNKYQARLRLVSLMPFLLARWELSMPLAAAADFFFSLTQQNKKKRARENLEWAKFAFAYARLEPSQRQ
jgi:hypothetical protein